MNGELSLSRMDHDHAARPSGSRDSLTQYTRNDLTERTNRMGLLPCLRRGSDRWWLPRSEESTDVIGHLLLANNRQSPIDSVALARATRAIMADPPLFIFAALSRPANGTVEPVDLVHWLADDVTARFAGGDAFLGAPSITPLIRRRWRKLYDHFQTLPHEKWLDDAPLWLEVTGPHVSNTWCEQWPAVQVANRITDEDRVLNDEDSANCMLQQIARMVQRQQSLETSFDQRLHENKLGALKQLAYGLSHEINNPLANISTRAEQLQRGEEDPARSATLQRIIDQVYRAHEMIADLMFYANPPATDLQSYDLNLTVRSVVESFQTECDRQAIGIEVDVPAEPAFAVIDSTMVSEAVRALVRNSIDAIGCQGKIAVSLTQEDGRASIQIADSGPGLSKLARTHAFDPYFSGREAGRGLGLGLCRAYRIAKLHHGDITLTGGPTGCIATLTLNATAPN